MDLEYLHFHNLIDVSVRYHETPGAERVDRLDISILT